MGNMSLWLTSDLHIGHDNIRRLSKRPFNSLTEMEDAIVRNWNRVVMPSDQVIVNGDVAFKCSSYHAIQVLKRLNGRLCLVIGNHDGKYLKDQKFRDCFDWIKDYYKFWHNNRLYVVHHYPYLSWEGMNRGSVDLCAHRHLLKQQEDGMLRIDVGQDAWNYTPVSINQIEAMVNDRVNDKRMSCDKDTLKFDIDSWIAWAKENNVVDDIVGYLERNYNKRTGFDTYLDKRLQDPEFKKVYDEERKKLTIWQRIRQSLE